MKFMYLMDKLVQENIKDIKIQLIQIYDTKVKIKVY